MNISELLEKYQQDCELKRYSTVIEETSLFKREILLEDIDFDAAIDLDSYIRFWNQMDDEKEIPIKERIPIKLFINSPGGIISPCFTIIDSIKMSTTPVYTIVTGTAYSAAFLIAIVGHKRFCYKNATFMYHKGSIRIEGFLDANKFKNYADFYCSELTRIKGILFDHTLITEDWYSRHQYDDVWFYPTEAIELKIVDQIIESH